MNAPHDTDRRRWGVIEVRQVNAKTFHLTINGQLWSEVEWSPSRRTWCVQDAAGHCLAHCEHIVGTNIDQRAAVALAKAMIRGGRMPTPEEAERRLREHVIMSCPQTAALSRGNGKPRDMKADAQGTIAGSRSSWLGLALKALTPESQVILGEAGEADPLVFGNR
jgi:hypothetical protein